MCLSLTIHWSNCLLKIADIMYVSFGISLVRLCIYACSINFVPAPSSPSSSLSLHRFSYYILLLPRVFIQSAWINREKMRFLKCGFLIMQYKSHCETKSYNTNNRQDAVAHQGLLCWNGMGSKNIVWMRRRILLSSARFHHSIAHCSCVFIRSIVRRPSPRLNWWHWDAASLKDALSEDIETKSLSVCRKL